MPKQKLASYIAPRKDCSNCQSKAIAASLVKEGKEERGKKRREEGEKESKQSGELGNLC